MPLPSSRRSSAGLRLVVKPSDRRRAPRLVFVDWLYDLRGEVLPSQDRLAIRDLSLGGFAIESATPIPLDVEYQFRFTDEDGETFVITAASRHSDPIDSIDGGYLTGFEFIREPGHTPDDPVARLLDKIYLALS
jgi:hypothetical protein